MPAACGALVPLSTVLDVEEKAKVNELFLLTAKPVVYAANISESDLGKSEDGLPAVARVRRRAAEEGAQTLVICAKVEEELSSLDDGEKQMFLDSYGIEESGLNRLVKKCYELLGLISCGRVSPRSAPRKPCPAPRPPRRRTCPPC